MNASCIDENAKFKLCPYRVYTEEHPLFCVATGRLLLSSFTPAWEKRVLPTKWVFA